MTRFALSLSVTFGFALAFATLTVGCGDSGGGNTGMLRAKVRETRSRANSAKAIASSWTRPAPR